MAYSLLEKFAIFVLAVIIVQIVIFLWQIVWTYAIGPALNKLDFKARGKWALVTGCTDGIGKQYAKELAARGCDIVLISRNLEKLKATAEEIEKEYKVETKVIQADLSSNGEVFDKIAKEVADLEIGTIVNNVGVSYVYPEFFAELPEADQLISSIVNANILTMTKMTKIVLPAMVQRQKGVVINIGSASSMIPSPLLTVYAASKAYVEKFTEGLEMEYSKKGIIFQCVMPGFVCSNMSGIRRSSMFAPTAESFVKSAIGLVGVTSRTTGYLPHSFFTGSINLICDATGSFGTWLIMRSMENSRKRWLKKYKKQ